MRRDDERRQSHPPNPYLNTEDSTDSEFASFRRAGSQTDIASLRSTLTRDTSSSSVVAPGQTFADMARTGGSKKNEPFSVRPTPSPAGLMKLKPKAKSKAWKPFDLADAESKCLRS